MRALIAALVLLLVIDWRQTLKIARNPQRWYEAWNPILGKHPSAAAVHLWFAAVSLLAACALYLLLEWRLWIAGAGCAIEAACVVNNLRLGIRP